MEIRVLEVQPLEVVSSIYINVWGPLLIFNLVEFISKLQEIY
jgi:hypothetical protein